MKKIIFLLVLIGTFALPALADETDNKVREMANETFQETDNKVREMANETFLETDNKVREMGFFENFIAFLGL